MKKLLAFAYCFLPCLASAQAPWPEKPVRIIIAAAAGGSTDAVTRMIATELTKRLGQSVVAENRPGASGMIATEAVARSPGDGYTFLAVFGAHAVNRVLHPKRPYSDSDLTGVSVYTRYPLLLAANKTLPNTVRGLLDFAKANPGAVTFASGGDGTLAHLSGELFMQSGGVKLTHVPYKGGNTALPDMIAGRVGITFETISVLGVHVKADKLNGLGLTAQERSPLMPEVPTFTELGYPALNYYAWMAMLTQARTPPAIVARMSAEIATALNQPELKATLSGGTYGMEILALSPAQANQFFDAEEKRWGAVIRQGGIRTD